MLKVKNPFPILKNTDLRSAGILLLLFLAVFQLWFNNTNSTQATSAFVAQVRFYGEFRIGDGPWQPIVEGDHIPATSGDVTLRGDFHLLTPDGEGSAFAGWHLEDGTALVASDLVEEHLTVRADWIRMPFSNLCNSRWYTDTVGALDGDTLAAGGKTVSLIPNREIARTMFRACFTAWQASLKLLSSRLSE